MSDFCASLWPEEPPPQDQLDCSECGLDKHGSRIIWGEGNPGAPILILLDNPGAREDREGNPLVCGTRQTLQKAAYEAGFCREDLYATYVLKRRPVRKYDKEKTKEICMKHLLAQLQTKQPQFIICLGNIAVQSFFQDEETNVKSLRGKMHKVRGFNTAVAYHPLAVRRRPNLWPYFLEDWKHLASFYHKYKQN